MKNASTIKKIAIIGGGSAGWMTALAFAHAFIKKGVEICVVESPTVGIIGVGEGSTPALKAFFDGFGIEETEWMPECNATYKCGITFDNWSTRPGFEQYFHPFASVLDNLTMPAFVRNVQDRLSGADVHAHPNRFFLASYLAENNMAPIPNANFPFPLWYGYHFDATLLGQYLHKKAVAMGVQYKRFHVTDTKLHEQGEIAAVIGTDGECIEADFFVDCTGFSGLLIQKALGTPFLSFSNNLFNDAAIAMPTPLDGAIPSQTVSTALKHGWAWKIPLTNRYGNGYVYSSSFCSADQAEFELRERLGLLDSDTPARHLKMNVGRVTKHWNKNCLAVGLSQGFIEPLEATALLYVQRTVNTFIEFFDAGDLSAKSQNEYNERINVSFEGTRDYIVTHYKTNSRTDTEYWRANAANDDNLSQPLKRLFSMWASNDKKLVSEIHQQSIGMGYPVVSWYCILAGMGIFPNQNQLKAPTSKESASRLLEIDSFLSRSMLNFRDQRDLLMNIPKQDRNPLKVYFW